MDVVRVTATSPMGTQAGTTSECEVWLVLSLFFFRILLSIILPMLDAEHFLLLSKANSKP